MVSLLLAPPAWAAPDGATAEAKQHYNKAIQYYDLGRFEEAAKEFEAAYELKQDPTLLYNLAQAYRRMGSGKRALELYKNFLRKVPETPLREEVEARIAAL